MGLVRNINNPGMLAAYGIMATLAGKIAIVACNAAPAMAPYGGSQPWLGTNPLCIAIPSASGPPPILDMATSVAAKGALRVAQRDGRQIPSGWALDPAGMPTNDPGLGLAGTLLPMAGPKGSGLALMIDLLAGVLAGSSSGPDVQGLHAALPSRAGGCVIAIDPGRFLAPPTFEGLVASYLAAMRAMPPSPGAPGVLAPGERAWRQRERSRIDGVLLSETAWGALIAAGVSPDRTP